jgi:hypothetical protein
MQDQIDALNVRVTELEKAQMRDDNQIASIKEDTSELLETFRALKGAWAVLNWIGKLAKPLAVISTFCGMFYVYKSGGK